ncbi:aminoglycoside 6-adenylyltransferase, partial [Bacillus sp. JJ1521]|uniref:aminoglycoside 6-adenylyltransferase n=1 Tax=Bacillus sp. JJ1521 TaxID=3122957 RepID=UPI002FFEA9A9
MRSEQEMMNLILNVARKDNRIRAVYMNGSRTNPNVPEDIFQDYDIVYVVSETESFIKNEGWIHIFGELLMVQEPDKNGQPLSGRKEFNHSYGYLMLFEDGNRIDLHIETKEKMLEVYGNDKLTVPLLDKDNILPLIPAPNDIDYHVKKPSKTQYFSCCNDF